MRDNPASPNLLFTHRLYKSQHGMERATRLERPDALVILAFEEEVYARVRGFLAFVGCSEEGFGGLGSRGDAVEGFASEDGGFVDVRLYQGVRSLDAVAGEG